MIGLNDIADPDLRVMGTMTVFLAKPFSSFHFEGDDLVTLYVTYDLCLDGGFYVLAYGECAVCVYEENFSEFHFVTCIACNAGNVQSLILLDLELLAGDFYNCEHKKQYLGCKGMINPRKKRRIGVKKGREGQNYGFYREIRWIRVWEKGEMIFCGFQERQGKCLKMSDKRSGHLEYCPLSFFN